MQESKQEVTKIDSVLKMADNQPSVPVPLTNQSKGRQRKCSLCKHIHFLTLIGKTK